VFSLGGDKGLGFSFSSRRINCTTKTPLGTATAASGDLTYNPTTGRYTFAWKTDRSWAGTCRQLLLEVNEGGSEPVAYYRFT
jgi:hypothetical protein